MRANIALTILAAMVVTGIIFAVVATSPNAEQQNESHRMFWLSDCAKHRALTDCNVDYDELFK